MSDARARRVQLLQAKQAAALKEELSGVRFAQWDEMLNDPDQKIARPRQLYVGAATRNYVPTDKRK